MQDETTELRAWDQMERSVLYALTDDEFPPVMSVADVGRAIETYDPEAIIRPLINAGLVHRIARDFVTATPATYKWVAMVGHVS